VTEQLDLLHQFVDDVSATRPFCLDGFSYNCQSQREAGSQRIGEKLQGVKFISVGSLADALVILCVKPL